MSDPESKWAEIPGLARLDPMARKCQLELIPPTLEDPVGDADRLLECLKKALGSSLRTDQIRIPLGTVRQMGRRIREDGFRVTAILAQNGEGWELVDVISGHDESNCFGLAVDVGTTTVSLYLVDMTRGVIADRLAVDNPQSIHGEDILSRIHFCQSSDGLEELRGLITGCINDGLTTLANGNGIMPGDLYAVSMAGNPTMMHLLLGLDPYHICREPYVPVSSLPLIFHAEELKIDTHPYAPVYIFPGLGSYFGGDVVAGILASGMHMNERTSLLVDVGTNAEIVLGNSDWLVVCAGAAGPALEGGGIKAGMRATKGAIERVRIDGETLEPRIEVVGGGVAQGICGSGAIDLVAELFLAGIINPNGQIVGGFDTDRLVKKGDVRGYVVAGADRREAVHDIVVDDLDIGNILRAKGAMYTALSLVTERLGVWFDELESFFVAGSFGEHIDPQRALTIGMVPDIPMDRFKALGNSAGLGACMLLCAFDLRRQVESIRGMTTYLQLTTENDYFDRLNAAIFIPHTDRSLFPSVPPPVAKPEIR